MNTTHTHTSYSEFVQAMTEAINLQAMCTCNPIISDAEVAIMPECIQAYTLQVAMTGIIVSI